MLHDPELHYLDNAATTIVAPEVADVIDKAIREHWANPSSLYGPGARSEEALNAARAAVARTANSQFHGKHRCSHQNQEQQVEQHESAAAALTCHVRELPHISDADRAAGADKDEAKARAEALSLFLGFHTIPLFSQSSIIIAYHGEACKR